MSGYLNDGNIPGADVIAKISEAFPKIRMEWLLRGQGEMEVVAPKPQESEKKHLPAKPLDLIPVVSYMEAGMMTAYEVDRYAHEEMRLDVSEIASSGDKPFGVVVRGASMEPYYFDGDVVLFSAFRSATVGDDVLVYLQESGESTFKRLDAMREQGKGYNLRLRPLNPLYDTMHVQVERGKDQIFVALASFRKLDRRRRPSILDIRQPL